MATGRIFIRLVTMNPIKGTFARVRPPTITGYVISAVIQYHPQRKHFRTLRLMGKETTIVLDNSTSERVIEI